MKSLSFSMRFTLVLLCELMVLEALVASPGGTGSLEGRSPSAARFAVASAASQDRASSASQVPGKSLVPIPEFSAEPTPREFLLVNIFPQTLVPVGVPSIEENKGLANSLRSFAGRQDPEDYSALTGFLDNFPNSAWKPAILVNLGVMWRQTGYFSKALDAWQTAWDLTKGAPDFRTRALADRALGELVQINAWVGRYERLEPLFQEIKGRTLLGGASEMVAAAREGLWTMNNRPERGFMCGPAALVRIHQTTSQDPIPASLMSSKSSRKGFSLAQLQQLSDESGMHFQIARRSVGSKIIIPSVVHWRLNHYGALLEEKGDKVLIQDSTFSRIYGEQLWINKAALESETDGYFLVPQGTLPLGWKPVSIEEASSVWGKGSSDGRDKNCLTKQDCKTCPTRAGSKAMAQANAYLMLVSLHIEDTPLEYQPFRGPTIAFTVSYNQRDITSQVIPTYSNLGPKWTFNWFTYISDTGPGSASVIRYESGGGQIPYSGYNSSTGFYATDRDGYTLQYFNNTYVMACPDGSTMTFGQAIGTTSRQFYLSSIADPAGNTVTLHYTQTNATMLSSISDALGNATTLYYELPSDPYKITRVVDPCQRTAYFSYDQEGRLHEITDVIGMKSVFTYDSGDFVQQLQTPYGISKFAYTDGGTTDTDGSAARSLTMTDPNGDQEYLYSGPTGSEDQLPGPESEPPGPYATLVGRTYRNTLYYDKKVMKDYGINPAMATYYHWLHDDESTLITLTSGILESIKRPLENRVYFFYPNERGVSYSSNISLRKPSVITRVVEDPPNPSNTTQQYFINYNALGHITQITDPIGRQTTYDYAPNNIDLIKVHQTSPGIDETLAQFGSYSSIHRPATYADASLQVYNLQWNAYGQLQQVTNPKSETTQWLYGPNNELQSINEAWSGGTKTTTFTYDSCYRVRTVTDSQQYTLTYNYDLLDRLTNITYPDSTFVQYDYSRLDLIRVWDRAGKPTQMSYDGTGRLLTVRDRLNRLTQYSWCDCGGLSSITDPLNHITSWGRDAEGRVTQKSYDNGKSIALTYEPMSGRLSTITDSKNQIKTFTYYLDDTIAGIAYSGATYNDINGQAIVTPNVSFVYDPNYQRPKSMSDGVGQTTYLYYPISTSPTTGAGCLSNVAGPYPQQSIKYTYDELGRLKIREVDESVNSLPAVFNDVFSYDALGRLTSHNTPMGNFIPAYVSDTYQLSGVAFPNGQSAAFSYFDNLGDRRLKEILNQTSGSAVISKHDYTYDVLGQIKQWTIQNDSSTPNVTSFDYDLEGQLLNAGTAPQNQTLTKTYAYSYDKAGNRTSEQIDPTGTGTSFSVSGSQFNDVNQISGFGLGPVAFKGTVNEPATVTINGQSATITADPNNAPSGKIFTESLSLPAGNNSIQVIAKDYGANGGNTTTKNYSLNVAGPPARNYTYDDNGNCTGYTSSSGNVSYEWDAENRLHAINASTGRSEFVYDGLGHRVKITEKSPSGSVTSAAVFLWDGERLCEEFTTIQVPLGQVIMRSRAYYQEGWFDHFNSGASAAYFYTRDHLGSIREVTDSTGAIHARYDYDPYGRRTKLSGDLDADFGFTGFYYHSNSGLQLALYRAYDADSGRWINRDPIEESGGLNLYGYVANNVVNAIDPLGLDWQRNMVVASWTSAGTILGAVGGFIGGGGAGAVAGLGFGDVVTIPAGAVTGALMGGTAGGLTGNAIGNYWANALGLSGGGDSGKKGQQPGSKSSDPDPNCPGANGNLTRIQNFEHLQKHGWSSPITDTELKAFARDYILDKKGTFTRSADGLPGYSYQGILRGEKMQAILRPDGTWVSIH